MEDEVEVEVRKVESLQLSQFAHFLQTLPFLFLQVGSVLKAPKQAIRSFVLI